ncbi:hypothetical protein TI39_contig395g00012 [Zymoseptoria brevis]|uniref:Uncharacterized protein n=1 Tax=Zymoseptoria brevis TaxID=1047168 RepID=A0A0F4GMR3_9PEZI|nr:hypothetical protein TI39_contig395g00012 [Zymoseptoria brevis]
MDNTDNTSAPRRSPRNTNKNSDDLPAGKSFNWDFAAIEEASAQSTPPAAAEKEPKRTTRSKGKGRRGESAPAGGEAEMEGAPVAVDEDTITVTPRQPMANSRIVNEMRPPAIPPTKTGAPPTKSPRLTRSASSRFKPATADNALDSNRRAPTKRSTAKAAASTMMPESKEVAEEEVEQGNGRVAKKSMLVKLKVKVPLPKPRPDPTFEDYGDFLRNYIEGGEEMYRQQGRDEKFGTQEERVREAIANGLAERALAEIPEPVSDEEDEEDGKDGEDVEDDDGEDQDDMDEL